MQDDNQSLERAASICFERADTWKSLEQEALECQCFEDAEKYAHLCNEADNCKDAIRKLKIVANRERDIILAMIKLCEEASSKTNRPEYTSLHNQLNELMNKSPSDLIIVRLT